MASVIRSRGRTKIGAAKVQGGGISYINQAGASGRAAMKMGQAISSIGETLSKTYKALNEEVKIEEQHDSLNRAKALYSSTSNELVRTFNTGIVVYQDGSKETLSSDNYIDHTDSNIASMMQGSQMTGYMELMGKEDLAKFELWSADEFGKLQSKAFTIGAAHKVTGATSRVYVNMDNSLNVISSAVDIDGISAGLENLFSIANEGGNLRDDAAIRGYLNKGMGAAATSMAKINMYSGQVKSSNVNDPASYSSVDIERSIDYLENFNNEKSFIVQVNGEDKIIPGISNSERRSLIESQTKILARRRSIEKEGVEASSGSEYQRLKLLYVKGENVSIQDIWNNPLLLKADKIALESDLGSPKPKDSSKYNKIVDMISSRTLISRNDVVVAPEASRNEIIRLAVEAGITGEEREKLLKMARDVRKNSPQIKAFSNARDHAKHMFGRTQVSLLASLQAGLGNKGLEQAKNDRMMEFDSLLDEGLEQGYKEGKTWLNMLRPGTKDNPNKGYIVDDIIAFIKQSSPDSAPPPIQEQVVDSSVLGKVGDWLDSTYDYQLGSDIYTLPDTVNKRVAPHFARSMKAWGELGRYDIKLDDETEKQYQRRLNMMIRHDFGMKMRYPYALTNEGVGQWKKRMRKIEELENAD